MSRTSSTQPSPMDKTLRLILKPCVHAALQHGLHVLHYPFVAKNDGYNFADKGTHMDTCDGQSYVGPHHDKSNVLPRKGRET